MPARPRRIFRTQPAIPLRPAHRPGGDINDPRRFSVLPKTDARFGSPELHGIFDPHEVDEHGVPTGRMQSPGDAFESTTGLPPPPARPFPPFFEPPAGPPGSWPSIQQAFTGPLMARRPPVPTAAMVHAYRRAFRGAPRGDMARPEEVFGFSLPFPLGRSRQEMEALVAQQIAESYDRRWNPTLPAMLGGIAEFGQGVTPTLANPIPPLFQGSGQAVGGLLPPLQGMIPGFNEVFGGGMGSPDEIQRQAAMQQQAAMQPGGPGPGPMGVENMPLPIPSFGPGPGPGPMGVENRPLPIPAGPAVLPWAPRLNEFRPI